MGPWEASKKPPILNEPGSTSWWNGWIIPFLWLKINKQNKCKTKTINQLSSCSNVSTIYKYLHYIYTVRWFVCWLKPHHFMLTMGSNRANLRPLLAKIMATSKKIEKSFEKLCPTILVGLYFSWLVVYLPLWKIWKWVGIILPNIWKNNPNVPNHQPGIDFYFSGDCHTLWPYGSRHFHQIIPHPQSYP